MLTTLGLTASIFGWASTSMGVVGLAELWALMGLIPLGVYLHIIGYTLLYSWGRDLNLVYDPTPIPLATMNSSHDQPNPSDDTTHASTSPSTSNSAYSSSMSATISSAAATGSSPSSSSTNRSFVHWVLVNQAQIYQTASYAFLCSIMVGLACLTWALNCTQLLCEDLRKASLAVALFGVLTNVSIGMTNLIVAVHGNTQVRKAQRFE